MIALALIVVLLAGSLALHAVAIRFGARWAKVPGVSFWRAVRVMVLLFFVTLVLSAVVGMVFSQGDASPAAEFVVPIVVTAVAECLLLAILFRVSVWRGVQIWLPRLGTTAVTLAFLFLVVKPFVLQPFIQTSQSMAPTVLGPHSPGTCPHCGGPATAAVEMDFPPGERTDHFGICSACQQTGTVAVPPQMKMQVTAADRFVVCKFLPPARWDVVAVHTPVEPSALMAKRVVGLPGEDVVIRDGGVWINGARQELPADISNLHYTTAPEHTPDGFGSPDRPVRLGPDEYFVLGDFSLRSTDSRTWGPVSRKNVEGVVSLIYFPLGRVRLMK